MPLLTMRKRLSLGTTSGVKASEFPIAGANESLRESSSLGFHRFFVGGWGSPLYQRNDAVPATFSSLPRRCGLGSCENRRIAFRVRLESTLSDGHRCPSARVGRCANREVKVAMNRRTP
jgi:hypothetical protein